MLKDKNLNKNNSIESAKEIAISALSLLISKEEHLFRFTSTVGIDVTDIPSMANTKDFLGGLLDYYLSDENLLLEFCALEKIKPEKVMKAAHDLGAGVWERDHA